MKIMCFPNQWISWIKVCLESTSISVLVHGSSTREFSMRRELRQGDPLSSFLFLVVAEGLTALMRMAVQNGLFRRTAVGNQNLTVSFIQFADDTMCLEHQQQLLRGLMQFKEISYGGLRLRKRKYHGRSAVNKRERGIGDKKYSKI